MRTTLDDTDLRELHARLAHANRRLTEAYPGERADRQPVHTVYGGAQLFSADIAQKLGVAALRVLRDCGPDPDTFARAIGMPGDAAAHWAVFDRVVAKLEREPVEDFRIDFEDGYGNRADDEEDAHAVQDAGEMARGLAEGILPSWCGIRVKPLTEELRGRSLRTLDLFLSTLVRGTGGRLPAHFIVTLPKITSADQVSALAEALGLLETRLGLAAGAVPIELMVETPQSLFGPDGHVALPALVAAGRGRVLSAHFGTYDFTASCNITARYQLPDHPACDFARHIMQVSLAGTGIMISDGATTVMPVGPHRAQPGGPPLTPEQDEENRSAVHRAWRIHFEDVRHSLRDAFYQGWDLHPAQFPTRYAAVFSFFHEAKDEAGARLKAFVEKAAQATLVGAFFDDAATGQGLLNFFLRGINCGAISEAEVLGTGLTLEELRTRSFLKILKGRRGLG